MTCPLDLSHKPCSSCMYVSKTGRCLYSAQLSVEEFAKAKGIRFVDIEETIQSSEKRIKMGLLSFSYLEWFRQADYTTGSSVAADNVLKEVPVLAALGYRASELAAMAQDSVWKSFQAVNPGATEVPLNEALLLTEWQLEELSHSNEAESVGL